MNVAARVMRRRPFSTFASSGSSRWSSSSVSSCLASLSGVIRRGFLLNLWPTARGHTCLDNGRASRIFDDRSGGPDGELLAPVLPPAAVTDRGAVLCPVRSGGAGKRPPPLLDQPACPTGRGPPRPPEHPPHMDGRRQGGQHFFWARRNIHILRYPPGS